MIQGQLKKLLAAIPVKPQSRLVHRQKPPALPVTYPHRLRVFFKQLAISGVTFPQCHIAPFPVRIRLASPAFSNESFTAISRELLYYIPANKKEE
jgi:hypothetical protein